MRFSRLLSVLVVPALIILSLSSLSAENSVESRRFAILVGVNQYFDSGFVSLQKAQNDAEDMGKALSRLGGYKVVNIMSGSLQPSDPMYPSKNKILERVEALAEVARPEDQVLFFFSGHGVNDKGESFILPIDAQVKDPRSTGIDLQREVIDPLEKAGIKNIVCLVDACQKTLAKDKGLRVVGINEFGASGRAVVITATGKGKASYEDPKGANGLFTRSILAALNGEGDLDRDGNLSLTELERFLPDAVAEYALAVGLSQKPAVFDSGSGAQQPSLARLGLALQGQGTAQTSSPTPVSVQAPQASAKAQFVQFKLPEGVRIDLRLLGSDGREIKTWSDTSSFSEKLEPGNYRIEAQDRSYLYYPYTAMIAVGSSKVTVALDLKPNFGSLALSCDPSDGVDVLLNGEKRGSLNGGVLRIDRLKSGSYELVAGKDLYDSKRQTIQIEDGKVVQVKLALSPNFFTLSVSEKENMAASLFVDGQNKGSLPQTLKLPFRNVSLRVVPDDSRYKEWSDTISPASKGSMEKRVAVLSGRTGTLEVTTNPDADAQLTLTPSGGSASASAPQKIGTAPLDYDALVGDYELRAEATVNGKKLVGSVKVTVREGQVSPLWLELKEGAILPANFVLVPGGTFTMGSPAGEKDRENNEVQHQVSLSSFVISKYDVTVGEFRDFVNATGYRTSGEADGKGGTVLTGSTWEQKADATWKNPYFVQSDQNPVVLVSWYDAVAYCNWKSMSEGKSPSYRYKGEADFKKWPNDWNTKTHNNDIACDFSASGYRLPTEAEWEFAAKGGAAATSLAVNAVYAGSPNIDTVAWYWGNSGKQTHPVGQKAPNSLSLYDMAGNVWQWCWDLYGNYSGGSQSDPLGPASGSYRVLRGGSWSSDAADLGSAHRYYNSPYYRNYSIGFRVLLSQSR